MAPSVYVEQRWVCFQRLRTSTTAGRLLLLTAFKHTTKEVLAASEFLILEQSYLILLPHMITRDKRLLLS